MLTPAKTNLYLTVGACRPEDGRHEIRTLFVPIRRLCDEITVTPATTPALTLHCTGRTIGGLADPAGNIVLKAARLFCDTFGIAPAFTLHLHKRIPVSAGLGGGSSDAAAVLLELKRLTGCPGSVAELRPLAHRLGADVAFFLEPAPASGTGIGDELRPAEIAAEFECIIAYPGFPSPVSWAYRHWRRPRTAVPPDWSRLPDATATLPQLAAYLWNDLQFALAAKFPLLQLILDAMQQTPDVAGAIVSGSGCSCMALCPPGSAAGVRRHLSAVLPATVEIL